MRSKSPLSDRARLLVACADQPGIVATVAGCLFQRGANIIHSDQHSTDPRGGRFFLRVEFDLPGVAERADDLERELQAEEMLPAQAVLRVVPLARRKRLAVFVSKEDHCLRELLWQQESGDLPGEIAVIISNHRDLEPIAHQYQIPFYQVSVTPDTRKEAEQQHLTLLEDANVDAVVLARYMQIVTPMFISPWQHRLINIHHSFLPAFVGAKPYAQAHERGVKIIGATAHYVTTELDAGPIIEQDVQRVDHRQTVDDLKRLGRQIERTVLARAVRWHVEDRVLVDGNKTIVFP